MDCEIGDKFIVIRRGRLFELENGQILTFDKKGTWNDQQTINFGGYFVLGETLSSPNKTFKVCKYSPALEILYGL